MEYPESECWPVLIVPPSQWNCLMRPIVWGGSSIHITGMGDYDLNTCGHILQILSETMKMDGILSNQYIIFYFDKKNNII